MRAVLLSCLYLSGCKIILDDWWNDDDTPPSIGVVSVSPEYQGDLHYRNFTWHCAHAQEQTCLTLSNSTAPFPKKIAQGARFSVTADDNARVFIAGARFVKGIEDAFTAADPGTVAFYAADGGRLADFIHLQIVTPTALSLAADPLMMPSPTMQKGTAQKVAVLPSADDDVLAGSIDVEWKTSNADVVSIPPGLAHGKTLTALEVGTAVVTAKYGALEAQMSIEVTE